MNEFEQPTKEQLFALERSNYVGQKEAHIKEEFKKNPEADLWADVNVDGNRYTITKPLAYKLLKNAKESLNRALRDCGLEDAMWLLDFQELVEGKIAPFKAPKQIDICEEGHQMTPHFRLQKAKNQSNILYYKCLLCQPHRIHWVDDEVKRQAENQQEGKL